MEGTAYGKKAWVALAGLALVVCILSGRAFAAPVNSLVSEKEAAQRYCLWLFWSPDKASVSSLATKVRGGASFTEAAYTAAQSGEKQVRYSLDCLKAEELDPVVFEVARRLKVGQTSTPFALAKGWAMIMRTTMAFRKRGKALFDQGRHAQAERAFMRDLKLHPRDAAVWHLLALSRAAQRDLEGGISAIDRALALDPGNPGLLQDKATMLAYDGRLDRALELYRRADRAEPDNPTVQSNMAWVMSLMNLDLAKAQILAAKAVSAQPKNGRFWYTLGLVYQARGNLEDAVKALEQAASLPGAPPEVLKKLALAKRQLSQRGGPRENSAAEAAPPKEAPPASQPEKAKAAAPKMAVPAPETPKPVPEPRAAEAPSPPAKDEKKFSEVYLQVATALDREMALEELAPLIKAGYKPFLRDWKDAEDRTWMAFYLGPFPDVNTAVDLGRELKKRELLGSYLVRTMKPGFKDRLGRPFDAPPAPMAEEEKPRTKPDPKAEAPVVTAKAEQKKPAASLKAAPKEARAQKPAEAAPPPASETVPQKAPAAEPIHEKKAEPEVTPLPQAPQPKAEQEQPPADKGQAGEPAEDQAEPQETEVYLQIATLPSEDMARVEARGLLRAGYDPFVRTWQDGRGRSWEVVYLGPLDSAAQALDLARKLKARRLIHSYDVRNLEVGLKTKKGRPLGRTKAKEKPASEPKPVPPAPRRLKPVTAPPAIKPEPAAERQKAETPAPAAAQPAPGGKAVAPGKIQAPRAAAPVVVPLKPAGPRTAYLVVSVRPDRAGAYTDASRFRRAGYKARLSAWPRQDGKVWQRVLLGPFRGKKQALDEARELQKKGMLKEYELLVRE